MNKRTIRKVLKKKHEEFLASITNERVRGLVKRDAFITGGSIVSLLLNEPVSDYDYYFRTKEAAIAVAEYYVFHFKELNPEKVIEPEVRIEGERIRIRIQSAGITAEGGEQKYEYFEQLPEGQGEEYIKEMFDRVEDVTVKEDVSDGKPAYRPIFLSDNAITLSNKVQLVIRFWGDPQEVHKNYDYLHCMNYWEASGDELVLQQPALESILARQMQYVGSLYPICSLIRMRKFIKRGWHINAGQILKMCFQISELDLSDVDVLEEQLTGVDAAYFIEIIDYCRKRQNEEPEFKVTMPYLITIVDKIFSL